VITWPRVGKALPPPAFDLAEDTRLSAELGISLGSWAPRCRYDDPPAGILEMFGEYVKDEGLAVGWEGDHPVLGRLAIRARLIRFRPDGTAAYLEARLPGPGWGGTWDLSIRGLELERSAVRARRALTAVPLLRDWLGRDTTAATRARQTTADGRAAMAEALRAGGMTIEEAAEEMGRRDPKRGVPDPSTIVRYRRRKRGDSCIS